MFDALANLPLDNFYLGIIPGNWRSLCNRTVGEILADLEPELKQMKSNWSSGYDYSFGGETAEQAETFGSAGQALGLAIFLVFAVLVLQLGSFRQPFIILLAIPLALIGTMGGFFLAWIPFSFSAFIGIIALVGIVVNDAIVMVRYDERLPVRRNESSRSCCFWSQRSPSTHLNHQCHHNYWFNPLSTERSILDASM